MATLFGEFELQKASSLFDPALLYVDIPRLCDGRAETPVHGGLSIVGWGLTPSGAGSVDVALDGVRVTSARRGLRRPDVVAAHPQREHALLSGYAAHLPPKVLPVGHHQITVTLIEDGHAVRSVEFGIEVQAVTDAAGPWSLRRKMTQAEVDMKSATLAQSGAAPEFIVALQAGPAVGGTNREGLRRTFKSLRDQVYRHWRLRRPGASARSTPDGKNIHSDDEPGGAPRRFVIPLAPGDELGCDALLEYALAAARAPGADLLYCDERRPSPVDGRSDAYFKPAWSPDLLLSTNYIGRAWCADERLLRRAGLAVESLQSGGDYDCALRLTEAAIRVQHVPRVLCARDPARGESPVSERRALRDAMVRRGIPGRVEDVRCVPDSRDATGAGAAEKGAAFAGHYRLRRALVRPHEMVSIIIPTCAADDLVSVCIESLRRLTAYRDYEILVVENIPAARREARRWLRQHADVVIRADGPFNWSRYNNQAARKARGSHLLFLNDDIEVIERGWLEALLEQAQRPEVGVVGARLLYPDRSVQHGGVMLDALGRGRHAFRHLPDADPGYFGLAAVQRNVISVTGACLLTRRTTFDLLGGFDPAHAVINNDLDYCLRAWEQGLLNVCTPHARLVHHELASRSHLADSYDAAKFVARWSGVIAAGDPYFNPNLARDDESVAIEREPVETVYAGRPLYARSAVRRILVSKLDHIGDCITALPAVRRLQRHFPAARITVLAGPATLPIWRNEAVVAETLAFRLFRARSGAGKHDVSQADLKHLGRTLAAKRFDLAVDLRKQPDSRFVLPCSGARWLAGFDHQGRFPWLDMALEWDEDVPLRNKHGHVADDLVALVDLIAAQGDADRRAIPQAPAGLPALPAAMRRRIAAKPLICVHPSAGSEMRQWPLRHFAALIDRLLERHDCNVALIGGADETAVGRQVRELSRRGDELIDLSGALTLEDLMKLLAGSALFVGNNSGPQHLAAGLGVPTLGLHSGVVDAREWGPLGPRAVALRRDLSCSPCYIEQAKDCPRQLACLEQLSVAAAYAQCRDLLAATAAAAAA